MILSTSNNTVCSSSKWFQKFVVLQSDCKKQVITKNWGEERGGGVGGSGWVVGGTPWIRLWTLFYMMFESNVYVLLVGCNWINVSSRIKYSLLFSLNEFVNLVQFSGMNFCISVSRFNASASPFAISHWSQEINQIYQIKSDQICEFNCENTKTRSMTLLSWVFCNLQV